MSDKQTITTEMSPYIKTSSPPKDRRDCFIVDDKIYYPDKEDPAAFSTHEEFINYVRKKRKNEQA